MKDYLTEIADLKARAAELETRTEHLDAALEAITRERDTLRAERDALLGSILDAHDRFDRTLEDHYETRGRACAQPFRDALKAAIEDEK
jgi:predicted nuclease with TOPRIM domain